MRAPTDQSRGSVGFNMTPMIDVVFLLIIFFLVSSHLAQQEVQTELDLPRARTGQRTQQDDIRRIVVNVLPDAATGGQLVVAGRKVDQESLRALIEFESAQTNGQVEIRIRCDRNIPYRLVEPIMVACARAGVWKVAFAVVENGHL